MCQLRRLWRRLLGCKVELVQSVQVQLVGWILEGVGLVDDVFDSLA